MAIFKDKKDERSITIIKDDVIDRDKCENIIGGKFIDGVGCVVREIETEEGKVFEKVPVKTVRRAKEVETKISSEEELETK